MWISQKDYDAIMQFQSDLKERIRDDYNAREHQRLELAVLNRKFDTLLSYLRLVERTTPAKTEYVKKGGPERG